MMTRRSLRAGLPILGLWACVGFLCLCGHVTSSVITTQDVVMSDVGAASFHPVDVPGDAAVATPSDEAGGVNEAEEFGNTEPVENVPIHPPKLPFSDVPMDELFNNASGEISRTFKEMMSKLDEAMTSQEQCQKDQDRFFNPYDPVVKPCFDVTSGQSVLTQICSKVTSLEARVGRMRYRKPPVRLDVSADQHENEVKKLREEIDRLKRSSAFSASRNFIINGSGADKQKLTKLTQKVNTDLSFDPKTGLYKVPFDGAYHFSLSVLKTLEEANVEAFLMVDGVSMATASGKQQQASTDLVVALAEGQSVWTDVTYEEADPECNVTFTFSGFLLH